jgi:TolB-like protein
LGILPFANLSKDDDSEFLVEGVFRDLIQEFSRMQEFDVLSHQTSMDFQKSNDDALSFAKKHKIDFLIGGNIRSSGKRIRISVDLTDATDGSILWGEKYDRIIDDIFDLQDEIVQKMSRQLLGNIEISSLQRIKRKPSENINSYEWLIKGTYHHVRSGKEHNDKAIEAFDNAIKIDKKNARAHALKACTIGGGLGKNYYEDNEAKWEELLSHSKQSLDADENDFECLRISSALSLLNEDFKKSEEHARKAFSINPNDPRVLNQFGKVLIKTGKVDEGLIHLIKAFELDPIPQGHLTSCERYDALTLGYFCKPDFKTCISYGTKITNLEPSTWLLVSYAISKENDIIELKEHNFFTNKYDEFKKNDWKKVINGIHFPKENEINNILKEFSDKLFPSLKLVDSLTA